MIHVRYRPLSIFF
ncbi:hypothetical protein YPPY03_0690, partial [Yersinia pestis PY-03]